MTKRGPTPPRPWQPMRRGEVVPATRDRSVASFKRVTGRDPGPDDLISEVWLNDRYVVGVKRRDDGSVANLSIRRQDRSWPRDWRDFQRIKNDIAGVDVEAVELYPREDRLVDTANQFWLWCMPPGMTFPFGFDEGRHVAGQDLAAPFGAVQREVESGVA